MVSSVDGNSTTGCSAVQFWKAELPIRLSPSQSGKLTSDLQPLNALLGISSIFPLNITFFSFGSLIKMLAGISLTPDPISAVSRLSQLANTEAPRLVTESGTVTDTNASQFWNAEVPTDVTVSGSTSSPAFPPLNTASCWQPEKALSPMVVISPGKLTSVSELQLFKALLPMTVTVEGITTFVRLVQPLNM